ncbi:hypothetical protein [Streptomyces sp. NPDC050738]|uniref:hypothetical protein n=1 Tax=Streptomyces sp. NPDC050738 TaxID=3154744 RepID=UPI00342F6937
MRAFKLWLDRSLPAQAVLVLVLAVGINALFRQGESPVRWLTQGAAYAAVAIAILAVQRRRASRAAGTDSRGLAELNRKIRHREVPTNPGEQASMRRLVAEHQGQMDKGGRWLPWWLGFMGLIGVGLIVLGAATGSLVFPLVFMVGVIVFCVWVLWMRRRNLARIHHMRSALQNKG